MGCKKKLKLFFDILQNGHRVLSPWVGCKKMCYYGKNMFVLFCIKPLFCKSPLNSRVTPFSFSLIPLLTSSSPSGFTKNKGIRGRESCVRFSIKGTFKNKGLYQQHFVNAFLKNKTHIFYTQGKTVYVILRSFYFL